jgi:hypothetical protein
MLRSASHHNFYLTSFTRGNASSLDGLIAPMPVSHSLSCIMQQVTCGLFLEVRHHNPGMIACSWNSGA